MNTELLNSRIVINGVEVDPSDHPSTVLPCLGADLSLLHRATDPVEVTDDPDLIAWTRAVFESSLEGRVSMALQQIQRGDWVFLEHFEALRQRSKFAKRQLQNLIQDEQLRARGRVRAAQALARLGSAQGEQFLIAALGSSDVELCIAALEVLGSWQCRIDLTTPQITTQIRTLLLSPHPTVVQTVARLCARRDIPGAEEILRQALLRKQAPLQDLAVALAEIATQPESIQVLLPHLLPDRQPCPVSIRYSLDPTLNHPDPAVGKSLRQALQQHLLTYPQEQRLDPHWASEFSVVADETAIPILEQLIAEAQDPLTRAYAVEGLARLQPEQAVTRILSEIQRDHPWSLWIRLLAESAVPEDFDRIRTLVYPDPVRRDLTLDDVRLLIERLGDPGQDLVLNHLDRLDKLAQEWVTWRQQGIDLREVLADLHETGVICQTVEELMAEMDQDETSMDVHDPRMVIDAFGHAGLLTFFDTETGAIPCQHDDLIRWFGQYTAEQFIPECPIQLCPTDHRWEPDSAYTVQFIYQDRLYRFEAENYGDYYDVESVVGALNEALEDNDQPERFMGLYTGDQCACFVFADPEQFLPIAQKYGLALSENASEAMWAGRAFEQRELGFTGI